MLNHNLKIFLAVAQTGSITETAKKMYISQPSVSQSIKTLETELNVKLFYRNKRHGVKLTEAGNKIRLLALEMEHLEDQIYQTAFRENNFIGGNLKIGSLSILTAMFLPEPLRIFKERYPEVSITLLEGSPTQLREMSEEHSVDLSLSCSPFGKLDHEILMSDKMVGIVSERSKGMKAIDLTKNNEGLLIVKENFETTNESLLGKLRLDPTATFTTFSAASVINLVKKGVGNGIISKYTLEMIAPGTPFIPVKPEIDIEVGVQCVDLNDLTPVAKEFLKILREYTNTYDNNS